MSHSSEEFSEDFPFVENTDPLLSITPAVPPPQRRLRLPKERKSAEKDKKKRSKQGTKKWPLYHISFQLEGSITLVPVDQKEDIDWKQRRTNKKPTHFSFSKSIGFSVARVQQPLHLGFQRFRFVHASVRVKTSDACNKTTNKRKKRNEKEASDDDAYKGEWPPNVNWTPQKDSQISESLF